MRQANIRIRWEGPDKKVREAIEQILDSFFENVLSEISGVTFADSDVEFKTRATGQ